MAHWRQLAASSPWGVRAMPRGGVLDGHFYVISGRTGPWKIYGDTWRSPDGINWECMSVKAGWGKRCYAEVDIIDGQLILTTRNGYALALDQHDGAAVWWGEYRDSLKKPTALDQRVLVGADDGHLLVFEP